MSKEVEYEIKTPEIEELPLEEESPIPSTTTSFPEDEEEVEDEDDEEDWDEEESQSHGGLLGKLLLCILTFLLGVAVTSYYFITMLEEERQNATEIQVEVLAEPEPEPPTVDDLLLSGVAFGDTVTEMLLENPSLHALSHQGNHYGLFENDLEFPLDVAVTVGNIFYFFDDAQGMHSVQYLLRPEESALTEGEIKAISQELDEKYSVYYTGEGFSVWSCSDGFVGFQRDMMYLYASQDEERVREIFLEEGPEVS